MYHISLLYAGKKSGFESATPPWTVQRIGGVRVGRDVAKEHCVNGPTNVPSQMASKSKEFQAGLKFWACSGTLCFFSYKNRGFELMKLG